MRKNLPWLAAGIVIVAAALLYYFVLREPAPAPAPAAQAVPVEPPSPPAAEPTIVPGESAVPLPGLDQSDAAVDEWLFAALGREAVERFLVRHGIVRSIVATVDNLPRRKLDLAVRAVRPLPGPFRVEDEGGTLRLGPANYERYAAAMTVVNAADPVRLADLYVRIYPLLQQAYEELGYPGRQFHVRLLEAIDDLLDAPDLEGAVALARPHVLYEFADPDLESRSAGQKIMLRIGPQNATAVKERLETFRAEIVARSAMPQPAQ